MPYSAEVRHQAFLNFLSGMSFEENGKALGIRYTTIHAWSKKENWNDKRERLKEKTQEEYLNQLASQFAADRIKTDRRHRKTINNLTGKILQLTEQVDTSVADLVRLQKERAKPTEIMKAQEGKLKTLKTASDTLIELMKMERQIYGLTVSVEAQEEEEQGYEGKLQKIWQERGHVPNDPYLAAKEAQESDGNIIPINKRQAK